MPTDPACWARAHARRNTPGTLEYTAFVCHTLNTVAPNTCGRACEWIAPYGFVPEAGCPEHDPPTEEAGAT